MNKRCAGAVRMYVWCMLNEVWCRPCPTNLHSPTHNTHTHTTHTTHTQHTHTTHIAEAAVEVRRLEEAVGALGEESSHAKPLLVALKAAKANSTSPSASRSNQRHSIWNESGRGWRRPKPRSPESQHRRTNVLPMWKQPNGGWSGCKIQCRPRCNRSPRSWLCCTVASTS